jgi:hypothetical protein
VEECVNFARAVGYKKITLWTQSILVAARHIYQNAGFHLVEEKTNVKFGRDLVSQTWELDLTGGGLGKNAGRDEIAEPSPTRT